MSIFQAITEEQAILATQQLDPIYSQLGMLYELFPNAPRLFVDPPKLVPSPHVDGVLGSISDSISQLTAQLGQLINTSQAPISVSNSAKAPPPESSTNVLMVKSTQLKNNQQSSGKKNNK